MCCWFMVWLFSRKKQVQFEPWIYIMGNSERLHQPLLPFCSDSAAFCRRCPSLWTRRFGCSLVWWQNSCWDMCWLTPCCCSELAEAPSQQSPAAHVWHPVPCPSLTANCTKCLLEFECGGSRDTAGQSALTSPPKHPILEQIVGAGAWPPLAFTDKKSKLHCKVVTHGQGRDLCKCRGQGGSLSELIPCPVARSSCPGDGAAWHSWISASPAAAQRRCGASFRKD